MDTLAIDSFDTDTDGDRNFLSLLPFSIHLCTVVGTYEPSRYVILDFQIF